MRFRIQNICRERYLLSCKVRTNITGLWCPQVCCCWVPPFPFSLDVRGKVRNHTESTLRLAYVVAPLTFELLQWHIILKKNQSPITKHCKQILFKIFTDFYLKVMANGFGHYTCAIPVLQSFCRSCSRAAGKNNSLDPLNYLNEFQSSDNFLFSCFFTFCSFCTVNFRVEQFFFSFPFENCMSTTDCHLYSLFYPFNFCELNLFPVIGN